MTFEEKEKRLKDILFIMEYWEDLPERAQGKFEGMVTILTDFMQQKRSCINELKVDNENNSNICPSGVTKNLKTKGR